LRSPTKRIEADEPAAWSSKRGNAAGIQPRAGNGGTADQREAVAEHVIGQGPPPVEAAHARLWNGGDGLKHTLRM